MVAPEGGTGVDSRYQMTPEERAAFGRAVAACWVVEPDYAMVIVRVRFEMDQRGFVVGNRVELLEVRGGDEVAQARAYEAVRTAIIRCDDRGYDLPIEKYEIWREVEMTFDGAIMSPRN